ncbi:hypothetical protein [Glycomyces xiaoerkulensis]|uniref:hypothetical protein n=1 Tax=Glycomyces xiaoerkulensis TaxID=2038139 RepID=UPI000C269C8A|nr:hypothetical protein [Glycomyces xiaoerkulensis]
MSAPIVAHATGKTKSVTPNRADLERGSFTDGVRSYTVRVSGDDAPDSFQVHTGPARDIVLVVSGLNSGELHATWGPSWRGASDAWREWVEAKAFMTFYNGEGRFCDG